MKKKTVEILPVILSGGSGSRLWPLSREHYPKQLLPIVNEQTMFQNTVSRLKGLKGVLAPLIVCNESHRFMVAEQLRVIKEKASAILLEPVGRNTAPAVAAASFYAVSGKKDPVLLVMPADHVIREVGAFHKAVSAGAAYAEKNLLVTFGIVPDSPETGYGYIKKGRALAGMRLGVQAFGVDSFEEKPSLKKAESFVRSGRYLWNSGIFMFRASEFLRQIKQLAPAIHRDAGKAFAGAYRDLDFTRLEPGAFSSCPSDSIDYAVMEKTKAAAVIPLAAGWNDVGSWSSLWGVLGKDVEGNTLAGDVIVKDAHDCYINAGSRLVAAIGTRDLIIVETSDAVLVVKKEKSQDVKKIVEILKQHNRDEALMHRRVNRPWGAYEGIDSGDRFQVKRITVNPGASLSLQKHIHRAEHWIVVRGTALITKGDELITLCENQSTYIPLGTRHRLENPGKIPLELIEVQSGSYLGEDDIERLDDCYGREEGTKR